MCRAKNSSTPTIRQQGGELLRWLISLAAPCHFSEGCHYDSAAGDPKASLQITDGVPLAQLERYFCLRLGMSAILTDLRQGPQEEGPD